MNYPQPEQLFSAALLYSLVLVRRPGDRVPNTRSVPGTHRCKDTRRRSENSRCVEGSVATALAKTWVLPAGLMDLIGSPAPTPKTKWQTDQQLFMGLVTGCNHLVDAMTDSPIPGAADPIRRNVQRGTALPERTLQDALTRAFDKGQQLSRSVGITETVISQASAPAPIAMTLPSTVNLELSKARPDGPTATPPIQTHPLETRQQFQTSLLTAKDLNNLLSVLVNTLHDGGGFTRVALALLNPGDTDQLLGRVVVGVDVPEQHLNRLAGLL